MPTDVAGGRRLLAPLHEEFLAARQRDDLVSALAMLRELQEDLVSIGYEPLSARLLLLRCLP